MGARFDPFSFGETNEGRAGLFAPQSTLLALATFVSRPQAEGFKSARRSSMKLHKMPRCQQKIIRTCEIRLGRDLPPGKNRQKLLQNPGDCTMAHWTGLAAAAMVLSSAATAQETPDQLLWGDTHLHTNLSVDAYFLENRSADADVAYRFAKGEPVIHPYHRARVQLETPLDFLAVTDHAETLGAPYALFELNDKRLAQTRLGKRLKELMNAGRAEDAFGLFILAINSAGVSAEQRPPKIDFLTALSWRFQDLIRPSDHRNRATRWLMSDPSLVAELDAPELQATLWAKNMDAAERHNAPGKFTTLVGWEYTPTPEGANLHRIVLSNSDPIPAKSIRPFSANDSGNPEDLWSWLDETTKSSSADFLSIPHNSNISKGRMFASVDSAGRAFDAEYARKRARWESIVEVTQIKGTSETHPLLSPDDEFAGFEFFNRLIETRVGAQTTPTVEVGDYARSALKRGLEIEGAIGVNPYKFGMIGATDSHSGLSSAEENNFLGKMAIDSIPENKAYGLGQVSGWEMSASGLAAVWARANTREEIWSAFRRREVYGTTGPRIAVRFFGGFGFEAADASAQDIAAIGYAKGVPMGGDLAGAGEAPSFLVRAVKDPKSANLDRVQIVKGFVGRNGKAREKVYDVAWSGDRAPGANGKLPPVGDTVDRAAASWRNTIGAPELSAIWRDPDFDPAQRSFYYVRVLQIPTPRNSTYDSAALGEPPQKGYAAAIQERAYTSPIWYAPQR
jgi:hypothetical protein